jgi:adenylate cyclase
LIKLKILPDSEVEVFYQCASYLSSTFPLLYFAHLGDDPMATEGYKRKLTTVFSADVEGYSRLMAEDEAATVNTLTTYRGIMADLIKQHRGRVIDSPGDNLLAEFTSVVDAVQCAVAVQKELQARNAELPENRRMLFRIGINLGDVIEEEDRIYGDGVNIAARLESLASPGGICVSKAAFDHIESKLPLGYEYLGEQEVKNIPKRVGAYRVLMEPRVTVAEEIEEEKALPIWRRTSILVGALGVVLVVIAALLWNFYFRPPPMEVASLEKMVFPLPEKPSIAVLPFDNLSGDKSHDVLVDGMTEDIIAALARFNQLFVIARNSTFTYKGKPVKVQQVAEELGVRYVLEGSVQISGNRIRVTAQLIDATTGRHVWVERFDRGLKDAFEVQDEVTRKLVGSLVGKLDQATMAMALLKHPDSLDAHGLFLRGLELFWHFTPDDNAKSRTLFEKAISLDPNYACAYAYLADTYRADWEWWHPARPKEVYEKALDLAHKAVALDPRDADARYALGRTLLYGNRHDQAIAQFEEGLKANPNHADLLTGFAEACVLNGQPEEGIKRVKEAMRLNPYYPGWYLWALGFARYVARDYEGAIEAIRKMSPMGEPRRIVAACLAYLGRMDEARAEAERFLKDNPSFSASYWGSTQAFRNEEDRQHAIQGYIKAGLPE